MSLLIGFYLQDHGLQPDLNLGICETATAAAI